VKIIKTSRMCLLVGVLVAFLVGVALPGRVVFAHAKLLRADPKPGSTVASPPTVVRAWFNEELDTKRSVIIVRDVKGKQVDDGKGGVDLSDMDRKSLKATLKAVGPGTYTVTWTAVSADDANLEKGAFRFTIAATKGAGTTDPQALPPLKIISPTGGAIISSPVSIVFETSADLSKMTMGKDSMAMQTPHLHVDIDKRMDMPAMNQIVRLGANRYRYHLGSVAVGPHTIRVYWAETKTHKPMGPVQTAAVTVK
jgi:methionine-rich copper-binding protein CopC